MGMMAVGGAHAQETGNGGIEGTTVTVKGQGIYCGDVEMEVTQGRDGRHYLYDSKRKISVLTGATLPSLDSLAAKGVFCDYFEDCESYESIDDYIKIIANKKKNDGYYVDLTKYLSLGEVASSKDGFRAYRLKGIHITKMTTAGGKDYMPTAEAPLTGLHLACYHPRNEWSMLFEHFYMYGQPTAEVLPADSVNQYLYLIPEEGAVLHIDPIRMATGGGANGQDVDYAQFKVAFIPDESGVTEIDADGLKATITYEQGPSPQVDAYTAVVNSYDYYKQTFGRESFDGQGSPVRIMTYVPGYTRSQSPFTTPMANFAITIEQANAVAVSDFETPYFIKVGTGGTNYAGMKPFNNNHVVERSVVCHEFTHLVTATTAKLSSGMVSEGGAINESFSDIMAISMMKKEAYGDGPDTPWIVGGHGMVIGISNMRNMADPKQTMDGLLRQPDTYKGTYWDDDKYVAMGVQNKFYYLLCEGGKGTNDNGFSYDMSGIGIEKGEQIAYLTLTKYCSPETDYSNIRDSWMKAAQALYGENGAEAQAVANAWDAVGVKGSSPSGIDAVITSRADEWYGIDGRKLSCKPAVKGVYLNNGKKVIIGR